MDHSKDFEEYNQSTGNENRSYVFLEAKVYKLGNNKDSARLSEIDIKSNELIGSPIFMEHQYGKNKQVGEIVNYRIENDWLIISAIIDHGCGDRQLKMDAINKIKKGEIGSFSIGYSINLSKTIDGNIDISKKWLEASLTKDPDIIGAGGKSEILICHNKKSLSKNNMMLLPLKNNSNEFLKENSDIYINQYSNNNHINNLNISTDIQGQNMNSSENANINVESKENTTVIKDDAATVDSTVTNVNNDTANKMDIDDSNKSIDHNSNISSHNNIKQYDREELIKIVNALQYEKEQRDEKKAIKGKKQFMGIAEKLKANGLDIMSNEDVVRDLSGIYGLPAGKNVKKTLTSIVNQFIDEKTKRTQLETQLKDLEKKQQFVPPVNSRNGVMVRHNNTKSVLGKRNKEEYMNGNIDSDEKNEHVLKAQKVNQSSLQKNNPLLFDYLMSAQRR